MIFLLYSDLHIRPERISDCEIVLKEVYRLAKERGAVIINGGDTFDTRGMIRTQCLDVLHKHYAKWAREGLEQIILVGNHDQEDRAGNIHPHRVFSYPDWTVVDRPMWIAKYSMYFYPYMPKDNVVAALEFASKKKMDAIIHWGIMGAMRNDRNKDTDGVPVEWLARFRNVFSGHYHYRNKIENVQYIGSPMQQNFGEMDQAKGVLLYDNKKMTTEFIKINGTSEHHAFEIAFDAKGRMVLPDDEDVSLKERDFLRVRVKGSAEQCAGISKASLEKTYPGVDLFVEREIVEKAHSRLRITPSEVNNHEALAQKYVDFVDVPLDRARLMKVFKEVSQCP